MSERGGGRAGGLPGAPQRAPGVPANAAFHQLAEFRTLNVKVPRASIGDQDMAWCHNLMPVKNTYLRAVPDNGPAIYTVPAPS